MPRRRRPEASAVTAGGPSENRTPSLLPYGKEARRPATPESPRSEGYGGWSVDGDGHYWCRAGGLLERRRGRSAPFPRRGRGSCLKHFRRRLAEGRGERRKAKVKGAADGESRMAPALTLRRRPPRPLPYFAAQPQKGCFLRPHYLPLAPPRLRRRIPPPRKSRLGRPPEKFLKFFVGDRPPVRLGCRPSGGRYFQPHAGRKTPNFVKPLGFKKVEGFLLHPDPKGFWVGGTAGSPWAAPHLSALRPCRWTGGRLRW